MTKYIKDLRAFSDRPSFSFDGKYQYLSWTESDSDFTETKRAKKLKKVSDELITQFLADIPDNYKVEAYPGLKKTQQIAILIDKGFHFNAITGSWYLSSPLPFISSSLIDEDSDLLEEGNELPEEEEFATPELNYHASDANTTGTSNNVQVYTTCVLNEPLNRDFCRHLATFCRHSDGDIHIFFKARTVKEDCTDWQGLLNELDTLFAGVRLHKHFSGDHKSYDGLLQVKPSLNINLTAIKPLASVLNLAATKYLVVPHPRQALEVTYAMNTTSKSLVMTTGCINDIGGGATRIKAQTSFHSILGACVYDGTQSNYKLVGINGTSNGFHYFDKFFGNVKRGGSVVSKARANSMYLDDLHCSMIDYKYKALIVSMIGLLKPTQVISGDIFDGSSMNHHESANLGYSGKRMSLNHEVKVTEDVVRDLIDASPSDSKFVWLSSNHHNFVAKYLTKPSLLHSLRSDELPLVLRSMAWVSENTYRDHEGIHYADHTHYLFKDLFDSGSVVTKPVDTLGIIQKFHGHEFGINAASTQANIKITHGHVHRPSIVNGLHKVGFAGDSPAYQNGINASAQAFSALYEDGKRVMYINV